LRKAWQIVQIHTCVGVIKLGRQKAILLFSLDEIEIVELQESSAQFLVHQEVVLRSVTERKWRAFEKHCTTVGAPRGGAAFCDWTKVEGFCKALHTFQRNTMVFLSVQSEDVWYTQRGVLFLMSWHGEVCNSTKPPVL
jgi:hypothetical protein